MRLLLLLAAGIRAIHACVSNRCTASARSITQQSIQKKQFFVQADTNCCMLKLLKPGNSPILYAALQLSSFFASLARVSSVLYTRLLYPSCFDCARAALMRAMTSAKSCTTAPPCSSDPFCSLQTLLQGLPPRNDSCRHCVGLFSSYASTPCTG
jgi:hypothetical protein